MRADQILVQIGLAPSRNKAQELIESGSVEVFEAGAWRKLRTSSEKIAHLQLSTHPEHVRLLNSEVLRFVSRGGLKLEAALRHLNLQVKGWTCLDIGQSTGGFTDCLLKAGAAKVVGFDVGHEQLALSLRQNPQVVFFEGLHLKDAAQFPKLKAHVPAAGFDLQVADLSFISLEKALPMFAAFGRRWLALVKPQFEVGPEHLSKKGVVKNPALYAELQTRMQGLVEAQGWKILDYFASEVEGRDGNQEFFLFAEKAEK